ncbi:hypothetical protein [Paludibacter sp.]|uniref:hypothetical protein n=1 Tax=Paludibacter sp. TaxID=1898105 RepID=UPI001355252C|nr:hypothetical protein [Paludibacter sp.]MTK53719.1 hypothetical protein [Paludibacter sp.]
MKKQIFLFSLLGVFLLTSCKIGAGDSDYSPQISVAATSLNGVNLTATSTLDTLHVGDVLNFCVIAQGLSNPLVSVQVANDTTYSAITFPDLASINAGSILNNSQTDISKGYLYLSDLNIGSITFNVQYLAKKATKTSGVTFSVVSTSQYTTAPLKLVIPVK